MINNYKIETKLGLRFYSGGQTEGGAQNKSSSSSSSTGTSSSTSKPQMTPQQLLAFYNTALPQMLATTTAASSKTPGGPALAAANKGAVAGVDAINLNGLTPGESNAVERSSNQTNFQTGNLGNSNAMNTIKNAMDFGGAFNSKIPMLNNSTNAASTAAGAGAGTLAATTGIFSPIAQNASTPIQSSNSLMTSFGSGSGSGTSANAGYQTGLCCFIMLEAYHGTMPECVRRYRDVYYRKQPSVASGYKHMASWLVPLMKRYTIIRGLVWYTMVLPLTEHALGNKHKRVRNFWFSVWNYFGR